MVDTERPQGTARSALAVPSFRNLFLASFASNSGRWMQFAALGILGWELTESSAFLGYIIFAQLAPLGFLSLIGGSLADTANRRTLLLSTQAWQMVWTFVLAAMLIDGEIGEGMLLLLVFIIGLGQGMYAPAFTSILPLVAGEENLQPAIALNSVQVNGARVVGPSIGGVLASSFGFAEVFAINALTYTVVIAVLWRMQLPKSTASTASSWADRVFGGFRIVRRAPQVGRPILLMAIFALLCLPFIGQLPAIAEVNLGIDSKSTQYGWFYAVFGLGALLGAILVGTVLLRYRKDYIIRAALLGFAGSLAWLSQLNDINFAYIAIFLVALCYFTLPTVFATMWQEHVDSTIRGRVAAIWVLSFGGVVPIANLIGGRLVEATSLATLMNIGVASAAALGIFARVKTGPVVDESILDERSAATRP
ncbi:MAG: MFS transporter [Acidimicrobiia bacterium]|nr:MFS transporter [Acidimicrobiia bacterium]